MSRKVKNEPDSAEKKRIEAARKAIREAYWRNWAALPSVWVARDADNSLWIYTTKPMFQIDDSVYPEITFENSPIRVKLLFIDA